MPTYGSSTKYALRKLLGSNLISDIDAGFDALASDVDTNMAGYAEAVLGSRPSAGKAGRIFRATDTGQWFADTGSAWIEVARLATALGVYRTVGGMSTFFQGSGAGGAVTYYPGTGGGVLISGTGGGAGAIQVPVNLPDLAVPGLTTQFRLRLSAITNTIAPGVNFTYGLYPVASSAGAGASLIVTLGTVVSGSTLSQPTPTASANGTTAGSDFTIPSSGVYIIGVAVSGSIAANAAMAVTVQLQARHI